MHRINVIRLQYDIPADGGCRMVISFYVTVLCRQHNNFSVEVQRDSFYDFPKRIWIKFSDHFFLIQIRLEFIPDRQLNLVEASAKMFEFGTVPMY